MRIFVFLLLRKAFTLVSITLRRNGVAMVLRVRRNKTLNRGKFIPPPNPHTSPPPQLPARRCSKPPPSAKGIPSHRKARSGASTRAAICREPYPALSPMGMGGVASAGERSASAFGPARARREGRWCRGVRRGGREGGWGKPTLHQVPRRS